MKERLVEQSFVNASESLFYDDYEGDELCSYGAERDGEKRRGRWERTAIQPEGSELEPALRDAVRDSFFLEKLLEEHPWWDPMEVEKPSA